MRYLRFYELNEALRKGSEVIIFPGRFQPFHNGHIEAFRRASKEFDLPVLPVVIWTKTSEKSPFDAKLQSKAGSLIAKKFDFIVDPIVYKTVDLPNIVADINKKGFTVKGFACGSDRFRSYENQLKKFKDGKYEVKAVEGFDWKMVDDRDSDGPSATKIREAIKQDNQKEFERGTPTPIHILWKEFKSQIDEA